MDKSAKEGLRNFEIENDIITDDTIFDFDEDKYQATL